MRAPWSKVPALPIATGLAIGIACARYLPSALWVAATILILSIYLWIRRSTWASVLMFFVSLGIAVGVIRLPQPLPAQFAGRDVTLSGRVADATEANGAMRYLLTDCAVSADDGKTWTAMPRTGVTLNAFTVESPFCKGDILLSSGRIKPIEAETDVPRHTDRTADAYSRGATATMNVRGPEIQRIGSTSNSIADAIDVASQSLRSAIVNAGFNSATSAFILATVAGDKVLLSAESRDSFRAAGTAHVLAISGMHLGILTVLVTFLLMPCRILPGGRTLYYLLIAAIVAAYAAVTGLSPSVARAAVMVGVFCLARLIQRPPSPVNSLCVSVVLWLFINPAWLWSAGLQLSVAAVLALLWAMSRLRSASMLLQLVVAPIAALCGTSMLTVFYFHTLPTLFLPVNILAGIMVPIIMTWAGICIILSTLGLGAGFLPVAVSTLYGWYASATEWFASLPFAQVRNIYPTLPDAAVYLLFLAAIVVAVESRRHRRVALTVCVAAIAVLTTSFSLPTHCRPELYAARSRQHTTLLVSDSGRVLAVTDGGTDAMDGIRTEYADFAGSRGASLIELAPDTFSLPTVARRGNTLIFNGKRVLMATERSLRAIPASGADYLLVGSHFTADAAAIARAARCDTVLLAASLNPRVRQRTIKGLKEAKIPFLDLESTNFSLLR